jgi:hypothetical protein
MSSTITLPLVSIPQDVMEYAGVHDLITDLQLAIRLAEDVFGPIEKWRFGLELDPETDEESIAVDIYISLSVDEAVARQHIYSHRWAASATPAGQHSIVLLTDLI